MSAERSKPLIEVRDLTMAFGDFVVQRDLSFTIERGEVFVIMGGSGCGKSTLLNHMIGLHKPRRGAVYYDDVSFWDLAEKERKQRQRSFGVCYQTGALWSSMTLRENLAFPLQRFSRLDRREIDRIVRYKMALVSLSGFEDYYPSEISGGMRKRAALARAMCLDPEILFLDEPSAGLDPVTSSQLDELILSLRDSTGATVVMVTHELPSIFAVGDRAVYLDVEERTITAIGKPEELQKNPPNDRVARFLTRGKPPAKRDDSSRGENDD